MDPQKRTAGRADGVRLRVTPSRAAGRDRLYVTLPDGAVVAWYDRAGNSVSLVSDRRRDAVLQALAPYLAGEVSIGPPPVPTAADLARLALHPDDDLAPNRPGEALHTDSDAGQAAAPARDGTESPTEVDRIRSVPTVRATGGGPIRSWRLHGGPRRAELAAQEQVGGALDLLTDAGWRILHSVPLPGADRVDHLAVGPGGVLAVHTVRARRAHVRIDDPHVRTGRGRPDPLLRLTRRRATRAALALTAPVRPVLAVVGAARLDVVRMAPFDVRIMRDCELPALARLGGVLKPADIEALYALARDRRTWLRV
ncbi:nuclease-related domain-containing protein [Streptomyces sp. MUM 178J]|uniref:nuclease-related domain-containing protein n=1 Tax=Streptomyces sp. MUM 178J TaxID=2791991 RepID=UPI001F04C728|nr:nuclease-related domain-containing protein [Streptomyces sp. MUM 178J]WRQ81296.1 nuclease-related domain-containing protein [Streptomyces sp. MUM 178J]